MTLATGLSIDIDERKEGGKEREKIKKKKTKGGKKKKRRRGMGVEITRASSPSSLSPLPPYRESD